MRGALQPAFRHRHSGRAHWIEFHLVFPDETSVGEAHDRATEIEAAVAAIIAPDGRVITHLEPRSEEQRVEPWETA
jgi:divalent metal cation (Fe/Co/Zn/Cd) transporter